MQFEWKLHWKLVLFASNSMSIQKTKNKNKKTIFFNLYSVVKGQVQGYGWFSTRFPLKLTENDDVGETAIWGL